MCISCEKKEDNTPPVDAEPITLTTEGFSDLSSNKVTLMAKVKQLNKEEIIDYGFIWQEVNPKGGVSNENYVRLGKDLKEGDVSYVLNTPKAFEQGFSYQYFFYVQTKNNFYKGLKNLFSLTDVLFSSLPDKDSYGVDTITLKGDFSGFDGRYKIQATGAVNGVNYPYVLNDAKTTLTFVVGGNPNVQHGTSAQLAIVKAGDNLYNYKQHIVNIKYFAKIIPRHEEKYYLGVWLNFDQLNTNYVAPLRYQDNRVKILVNNFSLPYSSPLMLDRIEGLSGDIIKLGYDDGRGPQYFSKSIKLESDAKIVGKKTRVHPEMAAIYYLPKVYQYFSSSINGRVGGKNVRAVINDATSEIVVLFADFEPGEYDVEFFNSNYAIKSTDKVKIVPFEWTEVDKDKAYFGENLTFKGTFILGEEYSLYNEKGIYLGMSKCIEQNKLVVQVTNRFANAQQIKIGIGWDTSKPRLYDKILNFTSYGGIFDRFYPKAGMAGDIVTIEGKGIAFADAFLLGTTRIDPVQINSNKITFAVPQMHVKGKVRLSYYLNEKLYQVDDLFEIL